MLVGATARGSSSGGGSYFEQGREDLNKAARRVGEEELEDREAIWGDY